MPLTASGPGVGSDAGPTTSAGSFTHRNPRRTRIGPDLFKELLESTDEAPLLVVLNACKSAAQLDSLLGKVAMAIGMDDSIGDIDAIVFATRFYSTLAEGQSVEAALTTARVEMKLNGLPDHDLPTLRAVGSIDPADVRLITGE